MLAAEAEPFVKLHGCVLYRYDDDEFLVEALFPRGSRRFVRAKRSARMRELGLFVHRGEYVSVSGRRTDADWLIVWRYRAERFARLQALDAACATSLGY